MGPGYFIIAIMGCSDGATACTPVMTVPTRYESESACTAATSEALVANSNFDFPSLLAQCRPASRPAAADVGSEEIRGAAGKA
ncbi:MAG: hypothetical protein ACR2JJ_09795 [Sphingomicrobium sp.]